jgi:hypothetical protein
MFTKYHDLQIKTSDGIVLAHKTIIGMHPYFADKLDGISDIDFSQHSNSVVKFWVRYMYSYVFLSDDKCYGTSRHTSDKHCNSCVSYNATIKLPESINVWDVWYGFTPDQQADYVTLVAKIGHQPGFSVPKFVDGMVQYFDANTLECVVQGNMWSLFTYNDLVNVILPLPQCAKKINLCDILRIYPDNTHNQLFDFYPDILANDEHMSKLTVIYDDDNKRSNPGDYIADKHASNGLSRFIKCGTIIVPDDRPDVFAKLLAAVKPKIIDGKLQPGPILQIRGAKFHSEVFPWNLKVNELEIMSHHPKFFTDLIKGNCILTDNKDECDLNILFAIINAPESKLSAAIIAAVTSYAGVKWGRDVENGATTQEDDYYQTLRFQPNDIARHALNNPITNHLKTYCAGKPSAKQTDGFWMWY